MSKELKAIEILKKRQWVDIEHYTALCEFIETALEKQEQDQKKLKALEIIKEKEVDVSCLLFDGLEIYNENMHPSRIITKEEFDLLKEVLL